MWRSRRPGLNVPGRKTDLADAEWLAQLLECGLLRGSFIPPAGVKAVRDLVRYRARIVQQRVSEIVWNILTTGKP